MLIQRNQNIDLLRIVAAFAVVWLHISSSVVISDPNIHGVNWWVGNVADSLSRWCVPIFVMVSGALLLSKPSELCPFDFYRKRAFRLLYPIIFWTLFYIILTAYLQKQLNLANALKGIAVGATYFHLWYLYMIVGLYFVTPYLRAIVVVSSTSMLRMFILACFAIAVVELVAGGHGVTAISKFLPFIGYFVLGHYLMIQQIKLKPGLLASMVIVCGMLIAVVTWELYPALGSSSWEIVYSFHNPLVIVMSLCIFLIFVNKQPQSEWQSVWIGRIAPLTLGIYLIHPFWLIVINKFGVNGFLIHPLIGIPSTTIAAFSLSAMSTAILTSLPIIKRVVI